MIEFTSSGFTSPAGGPNRISQAEGGNFETASTRTNCGPFVRSLLEALLAGCESVHPDNLDYGELPGTSGRTLLLAAGKAAAGMAAKFVRIRPGMTGGLIVVPHGYPAIEPSAGPRVIRAAHPVPDVASVAAAEEALTMARDLGSNDQLILLLSGGASSLLAAPLGVTLDQKSDVIRALLRSGAAIDEINCIRKHLSRIKGGRLAAAAYPARVIALILSDVAGDDISVLASGPTAPDPTTCEDALRILEMRRIDRPWIRAALRASRNETPKLGDPAFAGVENRVVGSGQTALDAITRWFSAEEFSAATIDLGAAVTGEARDVAREHAERARRLAPRSAIVSGGELTVTVRGQGRGGPNLEYLLSLAIEMRGEASLFAAAIDSDGMDGSTDAAGAIVTPDTLARASAVWLDPGAMLENNDAYAFFDALGDLVKTGPTGTNVNDLRVILRDSR